MFTNVAHVDGACAQGTTKAGGWAVVINHGRQAMAGHAFDTTNNQMELVAIRVALTSTPVNAAVDIRSDSQWAIKAIKAEQEVNSHVDLIDEIRALMEGRKVTLTWIKKGTEPDHTRADAMAKTQVRAATKLLKEREASADPEGTLS